MNTEFPNRLASTPQRWDKIHDIRWFAENLNVAQFQALSTGLGLGGLRPAGSKAQRAGLPPSEPKFPQPTSMPPSVSGGASNQHAKVQVPKVRWGMFSTKRNPAVVYQHSGNPSQQQATHGSQHFSESQSREQRAIRVSERSTYARLLSAWAFDFLMVAVSLVVAFSVAVALTMIKTGETENWLALRPIEFLVARKPFEILVAVYAIFALYMIVFKLGAGKTIGEVIFLRKRAKTT